MVQLTLDFEAVIDLHAIKLVKASNWAARMYVQ